jgi:hypothetical protein
MSRSFLPAEPVVNKNVLNKTYIQVSNHIKQSNHLKYQCPFCYIVMTKYLFVFLSYDRSHMTVKLTENYLF